MQDDHPGDHRDPQVVHPTARDVAGDAAASGRATAAARAPVMAMASLPPGP